MSGNNGSENPRIIKTQDENGEVFSFELIDVIEFEGREYGLLAYVNENAEETSEDEEDEEEVVIMRLSKADGSYTFETIEDEDEFNRLITYLEVESEEEE
ncbi:MAG: hypothetical protein A2Y25_02895 [Candidatus Melainabacteria bacterium GWF2_37_15]|nr:MAG: hypothetical protein A2Y25_02895 [Candidatus Melainabacteria bacterium GWF2_37_15]